jgi:transposase-like protein
MSQSRRTPAQWRELVRGWPPSGLTQRAYCERHGISVGSLHRWRERLREEVTSGDGPVASAGKERPHLIPVELAGSESQPASAAALTLVFGDGVRLEIAAGCDPALLGQVIEVLRERAAP